MTASIESPIDKPRAGSTRARVVAALPGLVALAPALFTSVALVVLQHRVPTHSQAYVAAGWGLVFLVSMLGWGAAVNQLLSPRRRFDAGLRIALGVAVYLFLGGILAALSLVSRMTILASVLGGILCLGLFEWRDRRGVIRSWRRTGRLAWNAPLFALSVVALLGAALVQYLDAAVPGSATYNTPDDIVAYFPFAREFLGSGTLIEPFSLRRMASFGGQSYLQASMLYFQTVSVWQLHIVDRGLFLLVACALVVGVLGSRPSTGRLALLIGLTVLVALPNTRINTSSQMTGVAMLFALYRLLTWRSSKADYDVNRALLVGLASMAACTLRQSYMLPVAVMVGLYYFAKVARVPWHQKHGVAREMIASGAATLAFLLPWMILSYRSDATFLFPLVKGNFRPDFAMLDHTVTKIVRWQFLLSNVFYDAPVKSFGLFVLAGVVAVDRRPGRPLHAFLAATLLGGYGLVRSFQLSDPPNLGRYFFALEVAAILAVTIDVVGQASRRGRGALASMMPAAVALVAAGFFFMEQKGSLASNYDHWVAAFERYDDPPRAVGDTEEPKYKAMQESVPPHERILFMLDSPADLDYARNQLINFDIPGAVSPHAAIPIFDGGEAVAAYLQKESIRYVAYISDTAGFELYSRATWEKHKVEAAGGIWQLQARFFLAAFDDLRSLAKTRKHLYDQGGIVVLDLASPIS